MIELFKFQQDASDQITQRFREYAEDPVVYGTRSNQTVVPYFQALSSVTASGKTAILADAVANMSPFLEVAPVVLWLSMGKVVVEQTFENLSPAGKYNHLLGEADFHTLAEFAPRALREAAIPQVYFATVGTFNEKDKEEGSRLIYRSDIDSAERSTWESLKLRRDSSGNRRPLIVVYDEAHNLTDQQTDLLLELEPQAFLLASATMRLPQKLGDFIERIKESGREENWFITSIKPKEVSDAQLIKSTIVLGGYRTPMEEAISAMLSDLREAEKEALREGLAGRPKAIYVSNTNIVEGNAFLQDNPRRSFLERQAPPILIWRYLTEQEGVDPASIAVYANLNVHKDFPLPAEFILFSGGDKDYRNFTAGNFQHVIFNLGLQEGWDDPLCYFAYVDKSMESSVKVEQIIGRVLRQPNAKHFPSERLNTAHFYIRVDKNDVFNEVLADVRRRLSQDAPEIRIVRKDPDKNPPASFPPKGDFLIPMTAYDGSDAVKPIMDLLEQLTDYSADDGTNITAEGQRLVVTHKLGDQSSGQSNAWESFGLASAVSARWVFQRAVRSKSSSALGLAQTSDAKFDALIGFNSNAYAHIQTVAAQVVEEFLDNVKLVQRRSNPYQVGDILAQEENLQPFKNSVHKGYDRLNPLEISFAEAIDELGVTWSRNYPKTGYGVPLISLGSTSTFYPDFIVWKDDEVFAIDTTGEHLLRDKMGRKLLTISSSRKDPTSITILFISENKYSRDFALVEKSGFTLWDLRQDGTIRTRHYEYIEKAIEVAIGL